MEAIQLTLSENKKLIAQIHESLPKLETEFLRIQSLASLSVTDENFNAAIDAFYQIFHVLPLMASQMEIGIPLFRARPHEIKNIIFSKQVEISYNSTNRSIIKAGRFNQPQQSMFYGSLYTDEDVVNPSLTACLETCKELSDPITPSEIKDFTIGRWKIHTSFYVMNLCFDDEHLKHNKSLKTATEKHLLHMQESLTAESYVFYLKFFKYFSEMAGRKSIGANEYYILTALFYAVQYYYKEHMKHTIYGLIYPSAVTEVKGLNIVLTPNGVDTFLSLDKVVMYRFVLGGLDKKTYEADKCSDMAEVVNGGFDILNFRYV